MPHDDFAEHAAEGILGPNPFVGFTAQDIIATLQRIAAQAFEQPGNIVEQQAAFVREMIRIVAGQSELAPDAGDKRFQDAAWTSNPFYRYWLQSYLAWRKGLNGFIDNSGMDPVNTARARFVLSLMTEAFAPTNFLLGNTAAIKKFVDTGGGSLMAGFQNLLNDVATNGGMPAQVNKSAFKVGKNLACTPGFVVYRNEVCELIQYTPAAENVFARPMIFVPPQINKYYVADLSPGRSLLEYAVKIGLQTFAISWRNPTAKHRDWGLEKYLYSLLEAMGAVCEITGSRDLNVMCVCAGAITMMSLLAHLAAIENEDVHSVTLMAALLDTHSESQLGLFATKETVAMAKQRSQLTGVLGGDEMGRIFSWLRPNDLVWNYWVNNYLLGNPPPAFDILYWNNDSTRLPAALHGEFLDLFLSNPFGNPGTVSVMGTPIDLRKIRCDSYIVAGLTDHITPWKGCYSTTHMLGGKREFILSSSGHIQSIVNPPGNPKAKFYTRSGFPESPDEWLSGAEAQAGSWWEHWRKWIVAHSGESVAAPAKAGSDQHPAREAAPGTYVFET
jgi:polyhydroxyalkanoate synthase